MAGLLAWAADVVGGGGGGWSDDEADPNSIPLIFTPEQLTYVQQLDAKTATLNRSIQDLRLRLPPPDISERLPHLHAHSLASNNALALQLNAHSATKQEAQQREVMLQEEKVEYQNAITNCEIKIQERLQEAELLRSKLKEMDLIEQNLIEELQRAKASADASHSGESNRMFDESKQIVEAQEDTEAAKSALMEKLDRKKKDLAAMEAIVQELEIKWQKAQDSALKQPTPAQREKALDKQLHSLIEQLAMKQAQAEGLISEIHMKELELEKLNGMWRRLESGSSDMNLARNRFGRSNSYQESLSSEYSAKLPVHTGGRNESLQRLMLLRSAFMLYILVLHILVFIKLSF